MLNSTINPVIITMTVITTNNYTSFVGTITLRVFLAFYTHNSLSSLFSKEYSRLTKVNNKHHIGMLVISLFAVIKGSPCC